MLLAQAPSAATGTHRPPASPTSTRSLPRPAPLTSARRLPLPTSRCTRAGVEDTLDAVVPAEAGSAALLRHGLRAESLPRHVAVVMDGNSRWARARGLPVAEGHQAGRNSLEQMVWLSRAWGVRAFTAFACSHENLSRPKAEVHRLMGMFEKFIRDMTLEFASKGIRMHVIGQSTGLPASLTNAATEAYDATRNNSELVLMLAIGYSGRRDILQACRGLAEEARGGQLKPDDIDEALLAGRLGTSVAGEFSCPDLMVRTSGELRLSNFLLWQSAYSELFFTDKMWPDFDEDEYIRALISYQSRDRRFGKRKP